MKVEGRVDSGALDGGGLIQPYRVFCVYLECAAGVGEVDLAGAGAADPTQPGRITVVDAQRGLKGGFHR